MLRIKVCGITDPANAKELSEASPDYLGFIFYPHSKRYVGPDPDPQLFRIVPREILKTGVFVNEDYGKIVETAGKYELDLVQLHGQESPAYCRSLKETGLKIIKSFGMIKNFDFSMLQPYEESCDYFLFDSMTGSRGGSGLRFDWGIIDNYICNKRFFLAGGIHPEDIPAIRDFSHVCFFGIDINSRFEMSPGIKDVRMVSDFINLIRKEIS